MSWKKVACFRFIKEHKDRCSVALLCRKLGVSRSGYYSWLSRGESQRQKKNNQLLPKIREIHKESRKTYGSPRVHAELRRRGIVCNRKRVEKLMREHNIASKVTKKFRKRKKNCLHYYGVPNLLLEGITPKNRNQVWVGDVTYIRVGGKWTYLAVVMDLYTRKVLGWSYASSKIGLIVKDALAMAVKVSPPSNETIFHSDRGMEFTAEVFRKKLFQYGITQSMSRAGHCWDNAAMESFFHTLKTEMVYFNNFSNFTEATAFLMDYITFYNHKRIHSSLKYNTPQEYYLDAA